MQNPDITSHKRLIEKIMELFGPPRDKSAPNPRNKKRKKGK